MPKRTDIKSILIIGAGPIVIGQACEFDYSGTQACRALRAEGYRVILINSNPATIMTDPDTADAVYIEPITTEFVTAIIEKERPDALLPTMGGQTALNTALALERAGVLAKYNVELIGARAEAINKAEDRQLFRDAMDRIGLESPKSRLVRTMEEATAALGEIGLPAIIRPSFTLAGTGGGIAYNAEEFREIIRSGLTLSPVGEVLVEESVLGWKEYEMEVVRDKADNAIIICAIENIDPMGIHTGDSITVAPAMTLTDKEYQRMRNASLAVLREIGVETGGSNVQFAVNPKDGRMVVIEMNPRVSRSSALASKATGFPIAKIAAKLAVGYTLDELKNDITQTTPASFEPTIDYVVVKIPRFAFEKFPGASTTLTTSMKSVGEAMAFGGNFAESLQKALRSLETGLSGFDPQFPAATVEELRTRLSQPTPDRLLVVADAFRAGLTVADIHGIAKYDPWFLREIEAIIAAENDIEKNGLPADALGWYQLKSMGFSDARLAALTSKKLAAVSALRLKHNCMPNIKRVDTCAGEFDAHTAYFYSTYPPQPPQIGFISDEANVSSRDKVMILGGGPNRIGQGIEFDYCCVHAAYALHRRGIESIMVNCNPETVSTDYDTADRLYFEPLTAEDVLNICHKEQEHGRLLGVIVQFGGQTPLKLAKTLHEAGIPLLGTSFAAIDAAEDREQFQTLLNELGLLQPANATVSKRKDAVKAAASVGYPLVARPSYVLGGRGMEIVYDEAALENYLDRNSNLFFDGPLLFDRYLDNAVEVDVDAICDGKDVWIAGVMEHIEEAGIHSGDSACSLPPHSLSAWIIEELHRQTKAMALKLGVVGLMNVQFAIKDDKAYVLEVNPRASRTVPFVAKAIGLPVAGIAAEIMAGASLSEVNLAPRTQGRISVKETVFPFSRFPGVDPILGPEMKSTGEVMGHAPDFATAFAKAQLGAGVKLPTKGTAFVSVKDTDKAAALPVVEALLKAGFAVCATQGTLEYLAQQGITAPGLTLVNKVAEGRPNIVDRMLSKEIHLVINTTEGKRAVSDSFSIRRTALMQQIPYYTTIAGAKAAVASIGSNELAIAAVRG
jgi:carbamoyl-phosphate synthase large subunit